MASLRNPFRSLRWKRNRKLVAGLLTGFAVLILGFGGARVTAITSSERHSVPDDVTIDVQGLEEIFDDSVVHEVSVTFDQADYDRKIETFESEGTKEFIEASITIDGTTISSVGLRLKGNSTLMGLSDAAPRMNQQRFPQTEDGADTDGESQLPPAPNGGDEETTQSFADQMGGGLSGDLSLDDPSGLPWLISFDEYVDGQRYQGYEEIAIRPMTGGETMLNEALALTLIGTAGEPTQQASYSSFTVNGEAATLRLLVEVPHASYTVENFASDGVLYKALSTGRFDYLGEDPLAYADAFEQITRQNQQDFAPLIELLKWVEESSDEEFAAELVDYLDVESLARYVALHELLDNFDDMSGGGQNYYLWYDLDTETFTVLTWDLNLAFGQGGFGGMQPGGGQFPGGQLPRRQMPEGEVPEGQFPQGQFPQGQFPGGTDEEPSPDQTQPEPPEDGQVPGGGQFPGDGGMGGNQLKERFLAADAFNEVYAQAYAEVYDALYGSGQALAELETLNTVLATTDLVDDATLASEVEALQTTIETLAAAGPEVNEAAP